MSRVSFATTNWKDRPNKPENTPQSEWDAYNSSKFNGFPFPTPEKNQKGEEFKEWDGFTYFTSPDGRKIPSESSEELISVLGDHYSYVFTFDQLFAFFWRMKKSKIRQFDIQRGSEGEESLVEGFTSEESSAFRERVLKIVKEGEFGTNEISIESETKEIVEEQDILSKLNFLDSALNESKWQINAKFSGNTPQIPPVQDLVTCPGFVISPYSSGIIFSNNINGQECKILIDFSQPVLKTDEDEYRPYFHCDCCVLSPCSDLLDCEKLTRFNFEQMGYTEVYRQNDTSDRPHADNVLGCLRGLCYEECPEQNSDGGTERDDCIRGCNEKWNTNPTWSHARPDEGIRVSGQKVYDAERDENRYYRNSMNSACVKFVKVKVKKNENDEIEKEYINVCGSTTISGKDIVEDILKPNVQDSTYDKPGCYLFRIDFFGYAGIILGYGDRPHRPWKGCDSKDAFIASDTAFVINLCKKINPA
jgi:hypothetical protein